MLKVRDFIGDGWRQSEAEFLGITGDADALERFDRAFRDELARVGIVTANALAKKAGLGYDTAADVMREPHKMSRRVFWVVVQNLDVDWLMVEAVAVNVADAVRFADAYETAKLQAWLTVDALLMLDAPTQFMIRRMVEATKPKGGYPQGEAMHVQACERLREQLQLVIGLQADDD